jgi:tripartite-type tricarboxylate transporter receptor subunit TctC
VTSCAVTREVVFSVLACRAIRQTKSYQLNLEINAGLADPKVKEQLAELGGGPMQMTLTDFGNLIAEQTEKWSKVIKAANIKPE